MTSPEQLRGIVGATAFDRDGDKLGRIGQVYRDDDTDQPKWITVHTGLFGMNESFVPLQGAQFDDDRVTVAYDKDTVKNAPNVSGEQHLDVQEERFVGEQVGVDESDGQRVRSSIGEATDGQAGGVERVAGEDLGEGLVDAAHVGAPP
jgi:hypothetical protein